MRDDGVGGAENMAGRSEVLLQAENCGTREIPRETADVADIGAAPTENALVVVADNKDLFVFTSEQPQPSELREIDVLEFVGEDAVESTRPTRTVGFAR